MTQPKEIACTRASARTTLAAIDETGMDVAGAVLLSSIRRERFALSRMVMVVNLSQKESPERNLRITRRRRSEAFVGCSLSVDSHSLAE